MLFSYKWRNSSSKFKAKSCLIENVCWYKKSDIITEVIRLLSYNNWRFGSWRQGISSNIPPFIALLVCDITDNLCVNSCLANFEFLFMLRESKPWFKMTLRKKSENVVAFKYPIIIEICPWLKASWLGQGYNTLFCLSWKH